MWDRRSFSFAAGLLAIAVAGQNVLAGPIGYGVNASNQLFRFDLANPSAPVVVLGNVGFLPEGIDFRPGTSDLYAIDVGPNTTQLYTLNTTTGAATAVGSGFNSTGAGYDLTGNQVFGFDFNPKTLQVDNSMRIRLVTSSGGNLRLNSSTGQIAAVDTGLLISPSGNSPFITAAAYTNNIPATSGVTELYVMDARNDSLFLQNPPNNGTLNLIGSFGATIDALGTMNFDILTAQNDADTTIGGDTGYAVVQRTATSGGAYMVYNVNLATGAITGGALVGGGAGADFSGGFAVIVPEPGTIALLAPLALIALRRRSARAAR